MTIPAVGFPYHRRRKHDIIVTEPKEGPYLRGSLHQMTVEAHECYWPLLDQTDFDALCLDFNTTKGGAALTTFTPPDTGTPVQVYFESSRLPFRRVGGAHWEVGPSLLVEDPSG